MGTYGILQEAYMFGTHHEAEELPPFEAPGTVVSEAGWETPAADGRGRSAYEFNGDLCVVEKVVPFEDDAETALADLLSHPVMHADDI